jgi:hemerythrin-like domain-containing protein
MLQEHAQGREYIAQMSEALDREDVGGFSAAALKYSSLLRSHIGKENNVLFEMADRLLDEEAQNLMFEKFERHEEKVIGHGIHEKLHSMIHSWATDFEVQD